jgi:two-component system chemotaxis response regulator CheB
MAINVMIVDDSIFIRVLLKDILENTKEEQIKVVASVSNGAEAIKQIRSNPNIDVVTLDIKMPEMNGLETLKEMMKIRRVPVLMISSFTKKGADETIEALSLGAIDFITKESDEEANLLYSKEEEIRQKVIIISKIKVNTYQMFEGFNKEQIRTNLNHLVVVGSSTGGPTALRILLSQIPNDFHSPIVIAQHMPEGGFVEALSEKLNEISIFKVKTIENGEVIKRDTAYLCPGGFNVEIFKEVKKCTWF